MPFGTRTKAFSRNPFRARRTEQTSNVRWLLVINSDVVTSVKTGVDQYRLRLPVKEPDDLIVAFSDHPNRIARRLTSAQLVQLFAPDSSFQVDNPNALLDYVHPNTNINNGVVSSCYPNGTCNTGKRGATIIQIRGASLDPTGKFIFLDLTEQGFNQIDREIGSGVLPIMKCVSIFIDTTMITFDEVVEFIPYFQPHPLVVVRPGEFSNSDVPYYPYKPTNLESVSWTER